jgi:hypothetical protein
MKFSPSRFRTGLRRLTNDIHKSWQSLTLRRSDDAAEPDDLDRIWQAECQEMDSILERKAPGRFRK